MIPMLYEKDTTSFPTTSSGIPPIGGAGCLGGLPDCISCKVREVRDTGEFECTFEYPCNAPMYQEIKIGRIIYTTHDASLEAEPFDIYAVSINIDGIATFRAHHVSYRLAKVVVRPFYRNSGTVTLSRIMSGIVTGWAPGKGTGNTVLHMNRLPYGVKFTYQTSSGFSESYAWDATQHKLSTARNLLINSEYSVQKLTGGEFKWYRFRVELYKNRGKTRPAVIRFGSNLKAMTYDYDRGDFGNNIIPFWYGKRNDQTSDDWQASHVLDGDTGSLEHGAVVPADYDISGSYAADQINHTFTGDFVSFPSYNPKEGQFYAIPIDLSSEFNDAPDPDVFFNAANAYCKENNVGAPYENLTISFEPLWQTNEYQYVADTEKLLLCDVATVLFPEASILKQMKVVSVTWDSIMERYLEMEFGSTAQSIYTVGINTGTAQTNEEGTIIVDGLPDIDEIPIPEDE